LNEPIDLLNVAFENPRKARAAAGQDGKGKKRGNKIDISIDQTPNYMVPDRKNGLDELEELRKVCPGRPWNFVGATLIPSSALAHRIGPGLRRCALRGWHLTCRLHIILTSIKECQAAQPLVEALMWPRNTNMDLVSLSRDYRPNFIDLITESCKCSILCITRTRNSHPRWGEGVL
jgi:hypothetical protein